MPYSYGSFTKVNAPWRQRNVECGCNVPMSFEVASAPKSLRVPLALHQSALLEDHVRVDSCPGGPSAIYLVGGGGGMGTGGCRHHMGKTTGSKGSAQRTPGALVMGTFRTARASYNPNPVTRQASLTGRAPSVGLLQCSRRGRSMGSSPQESASPNARRSRW